MSCRCGDSDCLACYPTLYTGHYDGPGTCRLCGGDEGDHEYGHYCRPTRGLCPCGSGSTAATCSCQLPDDVIGRLEASITHGARTV